MTPPRWPEASALAPPGPWQYGLASLFVLTTVCAVVLSVCRIVGPATAAAMVIVAGPFLGILFLLTYPPRRALVVLDLWPDANAHTCCAYLCAQGIAAWLFGEAFSHRPRIVVRGDQLKAARHLLAELRRNGHAGRDPDSQPAIAPEGPSQEKSSSCHGASEG